MDAASPASPTTPSPRVAQAIEEARQRQGSKRSSSVLASMLARADSPELEAAAQESAPKGAPELQSLSTVARPLLTDTQGDATTQLVAAQAEVASLQRELTKLKMQQQAENRAAMQEVSNLSARSLEDQQAILDLQHQLTASNAQRQELEEQLEQRTEASPTGSSLDEGGILRLQAKVNELEDELEMMRNRTPSATPSVVVEDDESSSKLRELKTKLKASTKARQDENQAAMQEISSLSQQAMDAEQTIADLQQQLTDAEQRHELQNQVSQTGEATRSRSMELGTERQLKADVEDLQAKLRQLRSQLDEQQRQAAAAAVDHEATTTALTAQLADRVEEIASLKDELNHYQDEHDESLATLNAEANNEPLNTNQLVEAHDEELQALTTELQAALQQSQRDAVSQRTEMEEANRLALAAQSQQHQQTVDQLEALVQSTRRQAEQAEAALAERAVSPPVSDSILRADVEQQLARERQQGQQARAVLEQRVSQLEAALAQAQEAETNVRRQAQEAAEKQRVAQAGSDSTLAKTKQELQQTKQELQQTTQELQQTTQKRERAVQNLAVTQTLPVDPTLGATFNRTRSQPGSPSASAERALAKRVVELEADLAQAQEAEASVHQEVKQLEAAVADSQHATRVAQRQLAALQAERRTPSPVGDERGWRANTTRLDGNNADLLQAEIDNLEEQLAALRVRYEKLSKRLVAEEFARIEQDEDIVDLRQRNGNLEADVSRLTAELEGRARVVATLQGQTRKQQQHILELNELLQGGETSFSTTRENVLIKDEIGSLRLSNLELEVG